METKQIALPMWKYSMVGFVGAIILNIVARQVLKIGGSPVSVAIAFLIGGSVAMWFAKTEKRMPTPIERSRFLLQYSIAIALLFVLTMLAVSSSHPVTEVSLLIAFINWVVYPICAFLYMSDKYLGKRMKRLF